jgi:hypothetical protein
MHQERLRETTLQRSDASSDKSIEDRREDLQQENRFDQRRDNVTKLRRSSKPE